MFYKSRPYGKTKVISIEELKQLFQDERLSYVKLALLFGSRAIGNSHLKSDYDFALLMEDLPNESWGMVAKAWGDVGDILDLPEYDYDVIDLSHVNNALISSIKEGYVVLKGDENEFRRLFE